MLREAVRDYFGERAVQTRRRLRQLFKVGRTSLLIGVLFLAFSIAVSDLVAELLRETRFSGLARESLVIGGWVAMWRPLEISLRLVADSAEARLFDRLSAMAVRVVPSRQS